MFNNGATALTEYKAAPQGEEKQQLEQITYSVVADLPATWYANRWFGRGGYENFLPGVQTYERQGYLAQFRYHPQNTLFQSASNGLIKQVCGTAWELDGKIRVDHFQNVLLNADRNKGWTSFLSKLLWDFLTIDDGAVIEIIAPGDPTTELNKALVVGLGTLDPCRCFFTDNADYPVYYQDYYGKLHKMHKSRVRRLVDMPLPYQEVFGRGFSAFSRAISWVLQSITQQTYIGEMLNNEPPPGILNVGKVPAVTTFKTAWDGYNADRRRDGNSTYKPPFVHIQGGDGVDPAVIEFITFAQAPAGFDPVAFTHLQAQGICAAMGLDPQDLFPLQGGLAGTGAQSRVLDRKSYGRALGFILKELERILNHDVLPTYLEFTFKHYDSDQSREEVERSKAQLEIASQMKAIGIPQEAIILYIANTVEPFRDVLLDENGQLRVYDKDTQDPAQQGQLQVAVAVDADAQQATTADDNQASVDIAAPNNVNVDDEQKSLHIARKDFEDIRTRYTSALYDAWQGLNDESMDRRRAGIIARALVSKEGRAAYIEGLAQGGVIVDTLEGDDLDRYNTLVIEASGYISNTTENIVKQGMTDDQIRNSVEAYANKTLTKFYYWGIESGDKNGLYQFKGSDGKESCKDCRRLKGKTYRMREWTAAKMRPGIDTENFECGGWECQHYLAKVKGRRSSGSLKMLSAHVH